MFAFQTRSANLNKSLMEGAGVYVPQGFISIAQEASIMALAWTGLNPLWTNTSISSSSG